MEALSVRDIRSLAAARIAEERREQIQDKFPVMPICGSADVAPIVQWITTEPPQREFLFEDLIPVKTIGQCNAKGGVGKSNLVNLMAFAGTTGRRIGPFRPTRPFRVLMLNVEDPADEIQRRFFDLAHEYCPTEQEIMLLGENLFVYPGRGKIGPLMQLQDANAVTSPYYDWLAESVSNMRPEWVVLDTKSRLAGIPENQNEAQAEFIRQLEVISERYNCGFLVIHHNRKDGDNLDGNSSRGGQSQIDNSRYAIALASLDETDTKQFSVDEPRNFFKATLSKTNYTAASGVWYFRRGPSGVPIPVDFRKNLLESVGNEICSWLKSSSECHTITEILKEKSCEELRKILKASFSVGRNEIMQAIDFGRSQGWLVERNEGRQGNRGGKDRIVILPVTTI